MDPATQIDPVRHGPPSLRAFLNIAKLWELSVEEQMALLGINDLAVFNDMAVRARTHRAVSIPMEVIDRIGCILSIYGSLVTLLSKERTAGWLRAPNAHPLFRGSSALALMANQDFSHLRKIASYLLGQIHG